MPVVSVEVQDADGRIGLLEPVQEFTATVAAAVVDVHQLERRRFRLFASRQHFQHPFGQRREVVPFILDGNDDGGPWAG